jgi:4-hydroxy-4-methyl-2-oxoglutarate aldolase
MENFVPVPPDVVALLQETDTCTISNAIETFNVRMRNEGYVQDAVRCLFPELPPVVGYAVTGRIRTDAPPIAGLCYYQRMDWWEYVAKTPSPKIIVLADVDRAAGTGAFVGEIHAAIGRALGCVAYVTNGTVRDVPALERNSFQCFAGGVSVSHAYGHIVDFAEPVEIGGLKVSTGDLLQGDRHGVQSIPREIAGRLAGAVNVIRKREAELIQMCRRTDFSLDKLRAMLRNDTSCLPRNHA